MVDLVRSLSLQGRSRRNALLALRSMQQRRADVERAAAVYPAESALPRTAAEALPRR